MNELVEFLRAQLDKDEQVALAATPGPWTVDRYQSGDVGPLDDCGRPDCARMMARMFEADDDDVPQPWCENAQHIARHDPVRVLREVEAKRLRIEHYLKICELADPVKHPDQAYVLAKGAAERSLMFDALPYAGEPGYQETWRP